MIYTCCTWAGETFFPVVMLCQFLVLAGNRFVFYIVLVYLEYNTVVVLCQFFGFGGKQFLVLHTYLVYNTVVWLWRSLVVAGNNSQNENTFLQKNLIGLFYCDPLLIGFLYFRETTHQPNCVSYKIRTFYYCIFLSCIVQIYILTITIVSQKYQDLSVQVEIGE